MSSGKIAPMTGYAPASATTFARKPTTAAVVAHAHLGVHDHGAALHHREHVLGSGLGPADRPAEGLGCLASHDVLDVAGRLGAEAATHPRRNDPQLIGFKAQRRRECVAHRVGRLRRQVQGHRAAIAGHGDAAVGLYGHAGQTLGHDALGHHRIGAFERITRVLHFGIGDDVGEADVGVLALPHNRRVRRQRSLDVGHDRQRAVLDAHHFGRIVGFALGLRYHGSHKVADVTHSVRCQRRPVVRRVDHREALEGVHGHVVGGVHRQHTRHRLRVRGVNRSDCGMCLGRAHERNLRCINVEIVDVMIRPGQQPGILPALYRIPQDRARCGHRLPPCGRRPASGARLRSELCAQPRAARHQPRQ